MEKWNLIGLDEDLRIHVGPQLVTLSEYRLLFQRLTA
jgi:hypothetical protein